MPVEKTLYSTNKIQILAKLHCKCPMISVWLQFERGAKFFFNFPYWKEKKVSSYLTCSKSVTIWVNRNELFTLNESISEIFKTILSHLPNMKWNQFFQQNLANWKTLHIQFEWSQNCFFTFEFNISPKMVIVMIFFI